MQLSQKARISLEKVITQFQNGDLSPITQVIRIQLAEDAPARYWSLSNKVLALIQSGEFDCRGFSQWEKLGRRVKKGSRAVYILRPVTITTKDKDDEPEQVCIGFTGISVFAASSTEGDTLLEPYCPVEVPELLQVAREFGIDVSYTPVSPEFLGDCTSDGQKIRLGSYSPSVFFHELAHAMHARLCGKLENGQTREQETVAELTAAVLMNLYGYADHTGNA